MSSDREQKELMRLFTKTFGTPEGKKVLAHLRRVFTAPSYVKGDTHDTAYREGRRAVYKYIERQLKDEKDEPQTEE